MTAVESEPRDNAAVPVTRLSSEAPRADWGRKYPPLLTLGIALLLAVFVLPSSLNLPQTNPTTTLEYAPVPPDDEISAPPSGNFSSLGLGSSSGLKDEGALGGDGPGGAPDDPDDPLTPTTLANPVTAKPPQLRCVGDPPRQTEDPLSPPCVANFEGDNFGATYQGVTGDEIRLLIYIDAPLDYIGSSQQPNASSPTNTLYDLWKPPEDEGELFLVRGFRGWQQYFNSRFQTYGRKVHFFVYFNSCQSDCSPTKRRADAANTYSQVKPFAVISDAGGGFEEEYLFAMAKKGVLNFGSFGNRSLEFFNRYPKLIWSLPPALETQLESYVTYVCAKVAGHNVTMAGSPNPGNNKPRKLGIIYTSDPSQPGLIELGDKVKQRVKECSGADIVEGRYPRCCLAQDNTDRDTYAETQMADFSNKGVTTILWPGGMSDKYARAAQGIQYYPEWVLLGAVGLDTRGFVRLGQATSSFDRHAVVVSPQVYEPAVEQQRCYQAYREADKEMPRSDVGYVCQYYQNLLQFFIGVQVAGPRLGPTSIDKGYHAIPAVPSKDPQTPACFYNPGDYTCIKDGAAWWWDAGGQAPGDNQPGCWKVIEGGKRYLPGDWPPGNMSDQITYNEPCNGWTDSVTFYPYPV